MRHADCPDVLADNAERPLVDSPETVERLINVYLLVLQINQRGQLAIDSSQAEPWLT